MRLLLIWNHNKTLNCPKPHLQLNDECINDMKPHEKCSIFAGHFQNIQVKNTYLVKIIENFYKDEFRLLKRVSSIHTKM